MPFPWCTTHSASRQILLWKDESFIFFSFFLIQNQRNGAVFFMLRPRQVVVWSAMLILLFYMVFPAWRRFWLSRSNIVYKTQWGLFIKMATDWQVSEVGDTCRAAAGPVRRRSVQIGRLSAGTAHLGFPALLSVPHLLSREIKMNRRHCLYV